MYIKERLFIGLLILHYVNLGLPFRVRHRDDTLTYIQWIW
jgi:hypothetical protein